MSKLKLDIDIDLVQATVKSQVAPAVTEALSKHDVKKLIVKALESPTMPDSSYYRMTFMGLYGDSRKAEPLIDGMVRQAVSDAAKEYVAKAMRDNKAMVEQAFAKMMRDSESKLAKAFSTAITDGIKSDWGFELDVKVKHTVPARERDYE